MEAKMINISNKYVKYLKTILDYFNQHCPLPPIL